jgi:hypothetical protein
MEDGTTGIWGTSRIIRAAGVFLHLAAIAVI